MLKRATAYRAVEIKAAQSDAAVSELVNEAIRLALREDAVDLQTIRGRAKEPVRSFEEVVCGLKRDALLSSLFQARC